MLIYNYQKEFLGIDEGDLKALGFSNLSELRSESADFADLFVKTPGFVHNFKHVHWIDFVTCAEGSEDSKVIIHANGKNFRCTLDIKTAYLVDDPTKKAYLIHLVNLRALTHGENEKVAGDVLEKPTPKVSTGNSAIFNTPEFSANFNSDKKDDSNVVEKEEPQEELEVMPDPYETTTTETLDELDSNPMVVKDIYEDSPIDLENDHLDIDETEEATELDEPKEVDSKKIEPTREETEETNKPVVLAQVLNVGPDYVYDPHLASDELGLPVDLIEEFIEDFINQAYEFKDDLYRSINEVDIDHVKILSHKLKGVAANLRIEDAFEVLTTINTSGDSDEIKTNIDTFYIIIEKLSGKAIQTTETQEVEVEVENVKDTFSEDDDLVLSFKDDFEEKIEINIDEAEAPREIEVPKLADDDEVADVIEEITIDSPEPQYNKTSVASEIGIDEENFNELFDDYIIEGDNACSEMNKAIEQDDSNSWKRTAIKLKGMSDNMRISDFTTELESIIHTQDSNIARQAVNAISTKLQQISSKEV